MISLKDLIKQRAELLYSKKNVEAVEIGLVIEKIVRKFFDEAPHDVRIIRFKNGDLWLSSKSAYILSALRLNQKQLIEKINEATGKPLVKSIRLKPE